MTAGDGADERYWRSEQESLERGLVQLGQLQERALTDPVFAHEVVDGLLEEAVADGLLRREQVALGAARPMSPREHALAAGYYAKIIADYERRLRIARRHLARCTWATHVERWRRSPRQSLWRGTSRLRPFRARAPRPSFRRAARAGLARAAARPRDEPDPLARGAAA